MQVKQKLLSIINVFLLVVTRTSGFGFSSLGQTSHRCSKSTSLNMIMSKNFSSRKAFLAKVTSISLATILGKQMPANALFGGGVAKVNSKLASYGLPQVTVPDGFTAFLDIYGKGKNREPLLVEFLYPLDWVTIKTNIDENGEDGTFQAGEYAKGDTATLFVTSGKSADVTEEPKEFFKDNIIKAISQKGDNIYQDFKITKIVPFTGEYNNQKYAIVDFKYTLLSGAGFEIDRNGVASVTSEGNNIQVFWAASTRQRYKKTEQTLRTVANSFRCFADGIQALI